VLTKAILIVEENDLPWLFEFAVPSPMEVHKKTGMPLPKSMMPKKPRKPRTPKPSQDATIDFWSIYLTHKLIAYDRKESAKEAKRGHVNIYRTGHLLGAAQKVSDAVKGMGDRHDEEALKKFSAAMNRFFEPSFSPIKAVQKAMDKYISTGKRPKIGK